MKMKLRHMEVFRAIMLAGSISGAARMLYVSQSVVSRTLSYLEDRIGFELFDRTGGSLKPTENAQILFKEISEIFSYAQRVDNLVEKLQRPSSKRVVFSSSPALGLSFIPSAMARHERSHPGLFYTYQTALIKEMQTDLLGKAAEFCLSIWPIEHPNLNCETLFGGRLLLAIPEDSPLAAFEKVSVEQFAQLPLILYRAEMPISSLIKDSLESHGIQVSPFIEVNRFELACAMVNKRLGAALIHNFSVDETLWKGIAIREIDIDIPVSVYLVTSKFTNLSKEAELFISTIREEAEFLGY